MSTRRQAPLPDHYATLGLPATATDAQIKRAYRELAKTSHPDVNKAANATKLFARIAEAYEVLSDPDRRADYDRRVREQNAPPEPVDTRAHYTWTNIAARGSDRAAAANRATELDELYDTFFSPQPPPKPSREKPTNNHQSGTRKSPRPGTG